jgi:dihydroorotase
MFTHTYANGPKVRETVVDSNGIVKPFVFKAQERGIIFDVGHGGGAFTWIQAVPAVKQGFIADVISTDLHTQSMNAGMKDLCNVMSKFMALGLSIQDVVLRTTWNPAQVINRAELGNLDIGAEADVTVLNVREGDFGYTDVRRLTVDGTQKVEAEITIRAGRIVWDLNGLSTEKYD